MKVGFVVIGRMKSTRLPKKLTKKIFDREVIALMLDRLKESTVVDSIILATSTNKEDDILVDIANRENVHCFRGHEDDVLHRISAAADEYNLDYIVHITADCPLVDIDFLELLISEYKSTNADLITSFNLPHGFFFYGIKPNALKKVLELKDTTETEIWGTYFMDSGHFKCIELDTPTKLMRPNFRLTLDYPEDFEFLEKLHEGYGKEITTARTEDIIAYIDSHIELVGINQEAAAKYKQRWESQKNLKLK